MTAEGARLVLNHAALEPGEAKPRLSVDTVAHSVLVDGTRQTVPGQPFRLLVLLIEAAQRRGGPVQNRIIEAETGREPRDLVRELRDALSAGCDNAAEIRSWIRPRRSFGGFELMLEPGQIHLTQ